MKRIPTDYHKPECNSGFYTQVKSLRSIFFIDFYLAVVVLWSKGQKETVTLATCFREAPLMSAILRKTRSQDPLSHFLKGFLKEDPGN